MKRCKVIAVFNINLFLSLRTPQNAVKGINNLLSTLGSTGIYDSVQPILGISEDCEF